MGTFSYTTDKKLSVGNRVGYKYTLTDVQTSGSKIHTPFKKILGQLPETSSLATSTISMASSTDAYASAAMEKNGAIATLQCGANDMDGSIIIVGLL